VYFLLVCKGFYCRDLKPAQTSSEKSFGCFQAGKVPALGELSRPYLRRKGR